MCEDSINGPENRDDASLFRQQVIDAKDLRLHGDVILQQSLSTQLITAVLGLIVAAASLWAACGTYARVEPARGILVPIAGYSKIYAPNRGIISTLLVKEGDRVKTDQKLAVVRIDTNLRGV